MERLPDGTRIVLLRHAESVANEAGLVAGLLDSPLSERGRFEARKASRTTLSWGVERVVSSTLSRSRETALILGGRVDFEDPRLVERSAGVWEGRTRESLEEAHAGSLDDPYKRPREFEDVESVSLRWLDALEDEARREGVSLIVGHAGAMRIALEKICRGRLELKRAGNLEGYALDAALNVLCMVRPGQ